VQFVSVANGDAGHHEISGAELARRRLAETKEAGRRLGIEYEVLNNRDGEVLATMDLRRQVIRMIRLWRADLVLVHRPNDYHPDHRYTSILVQDAAYLVVVPSLVPEAPALKKNPVFLYFEDSFQRPNPFRPDIAVIVDDAIDYKVDALDAHVSQFYEWLPWVEGNAEDVPRDPAERKAWLKGQRAGTVCPASRAALVKWYGPEKGNRARYCESFEICEYGAQPDETGIRQLFPMLG
jgi:LmbE family N-acetylglucosaminyl deacetylase